MTPAERDQKIMNADAERRERAQAERDRIANAERRRREQAQANATEAAELLAELGPQLAAILPRVARLQELIPSSVTLGDRIRQALTGPEASLDPWGPLSVLGVALSPPHAPAHQFPIPVQIG